MDLLMVEGVTFACPWTRQVLAKTDDYDIDHLLPLSIYAVNELWNLLPAETKFNQQTKRDGLPSASRLAAALPLIVASYENYEKSHDLKKAVREDAIVRFSCLANDERFAAEPAKHTVHFIEEVANARSVTRF